MSKWKNLPSVEYMTRLYGFGFGYQTTFGLAIHAARIYTHFAIELKYLNLGINFCLFFLCRLFFYLSTILKKSLRISVVIYLKCNRILIQIKHQFSFDSESLMTFCSDNSLLLSLWSCFTGRLS